MSTAGADLNGGQTLVTTMERAGEQLADLTMPHTRAVEWIAGVASSTAPRVRGALAAGHRVRVSGDVGWVDNTQPHAGPIHWGWPARNIRASMWLVDAAKSSETRWIEFYAEHVQETVDTIRGA